MPEYYELTSFKPSDFKDDYGNTWCDAAFLGHGEPVKWVVKEVGNQKVGEKYYGRIEQKTSKANKPYNRFYAETPPEDEPPDLTGKPSQKQWDDKDKAIKAQFAIKVAVQATEMKASADGYFADIEHLAKSFYDLVEVVAGPREDKEDWVPRDEDAPPPESDDVPPWER